MIIKNNLLLILKIFNLAIITSMKILDKKNSIDEIVDLILKKAMYQKVVFCIDENSDMEYIDTLICQIEDKVNVIKYYFNKRDKGKFDNVLNNGARVVIYNVDIDHFYKLQSTNNFMLNVFIAESNFLLPYIACGDSLYGENFILCDTSIKDYLSLIFMYELAFNKLWEDLLKCEKVDTSIFKMLDDISNNKVDFYLYLISAVTMLKTNLGNDYFEIEQSQLPYYIYLRLCYTLKMLESVANDNIEYIDFYKSELGVDAISKAHELLIRYNIIEIISCNADGLIKVNSAILNRIKMIIKKYFNFKKIKLNKLNKKIKNQSKELKIENILYISYILNVI